MTRKDYIKISKAIKENTCVTWRDNGTMVTNKVFKVGLICDLCEIFKQDNNNFDNARIIDACE